MDKRITYVTVIVCGLLLVGLGVWFRPRGDEGAPAAENASIVRALESFASLTGNGAGGLCQGGFINEEVPLAASVARQIVENRLFDPERGQRAVSQDEAGISCLVDGDRWVLFTALNPHPDNDGRDYYCVDSTGASGHLGLEAANVRCNPEED